MDKIDSLATLEKMWASKPPLAVDPIEQCAMAFFYQAKKNNISVQRLWEIFEASDRTRAASSLGG